MITFILLNLSMNFPIKKLDVQIIPIKRDRIVNIPVGDNYNVEMYELLYELFISIDDYESKLRTSRHLNELYSFFDINLKSKYFNEQNKVNSFIDQ